METVIHEKKFLHSMFALAIPVMVQTLLTSSLNMVDSIMVGQLGVNSIASVGVANKITTILIIVLQGLASGAGIFAAQYWGKRNISGIQQVMVLSFWIMLIFSFLFMLSVMVFNSSIFSLFSQNENVVLIGSSYLNILSVSYIATAITILFSVILKSMEEVKLPLYISIIAIFLNTFLNYLLIFGHFGFPELGVEGAAIATVIARIIQAILLFMVVIHKGIIIRQISFLFLPFKQKEIQKKYVQLTVPSVINHLIWTLGDVAYFWIYAQMGTNETATVSLIDPFVFIFMSIFIGLGDASSVMVGNQIGAERESVAYKYAKKFLLLTTGLSVVISFVIIGCIPIFLGLYEISNEVYELAYGVLIVYSLILPGKMLNMVNNIGILRSGGDTKYVLYLDWIGVWFVGLPLALIGVFLSLPVFMVFALANSHEFIRVAFGVKRTLSKKWLVNVINH